MLGYTLRALKPCACPASRPKKKPWVSDRDISGFNGWVSLQVVLEQHSTLCGADSGKTCRQILLLEAGGDGHLPGQLTLSGLSRLPGKPTDGTPLTAPWIRTITSWAWGKCGGRSVRWVGCRWNRWWSSRGHTENKRRAILIVQAGHSITLISWLSELEQHLNLAGNN